MVSYTATYSPDDNKLRLTASARLDADTYARVKAAGFRWAPRQELFVAPKWTPGREDLCLELAGEIDDEDTSLVERAEQRAERFEEYSDKRGAEAKAARDAVSRIADNIPLGQPILVGHHSERAARKDKERIENGMRKAVKLWRTSEYWTQRAAGALHHAKYKELPQVRARRIKTLEAERRAVERDKASMLKRIQAWTVISAIEDPAKKHAAAVHFCNYSNGEAGLVLPDGTECWSAWAALSDGKVTADYIAARRLKHLPERIPYLDRWLEHYDNRLAYERAMLEEQGASKLLDKKPRRALLPILNYRAPDGLQISRFDGANKPERYAQVEMTKADYAMIHSDYKGCRTVGNNHRVRIAIVRSALCAVFLTDSKPHECPEPSAPTPKAPRPEQPRVEIERKPEDPEAASFDAMAKSLRTGVQIAVAPQLFPTPMEIAEKMVRYADIRRGDAVLEPSAGTGNLLKAIGDGHDLTALEINSSLCANLARWVSGNVYCRDFLDCTPEEFRLFDTILMNPPFERGSDIKHIKHALRFLKPGGRLVAICANGPRQHAELQTIATHWEELPADTFKDQGTGVRTALMMVEA